MLRFSHTESHTLYYSHTFFTWNTIIPRVIVQVENQSIQSKWSRLLPINTSGPNHYNSWCSLHYFYLSSYLAFNTHWFHIDLRSLRLRVSWPKTQSTTCIKRTYIFIGFSYVMSCITLIFLVVLLYMYIYDWHYLTYKYIYVGINCHYKDIYYYLRQAPMPPNTSTHTTRVAVSGYNN